MRSVLSGLLGLRLRNGLGHSTTNLTPFPPCSADGQVRGAVAAVQALSSTARQWRQWPVVVNVVLSPGDGRRRTEKIVYLHLRALLFVKIRAYSIRKVPIGS